jgi:hypothetical protein
MPTCSPNEESLSPKLANSRWRKRRSVIGKSIDPKLEHVRHANDTGTIRDRRHLLLYEYICRQSTSTIQVGK